ncbi:Hg(II)-responsive transcriptional regulator [Alkalihalobacillus berkeleyi]|uniref:Mercuric resistance operon regulatory protein n=1 Tax=Pseudalkalibacillus berkeleyi TaxID=1069813 RepID=A0ABS9GYG6_9BACL|nr:Hg(II)-responsive transcriptional regulator [Pseudalkalibacillus berkeleyi]
MAYQTGELAELSGVNKETIRYYERIGLLQEPPRNESGYRIYPEDALNRLKFIRKAQELGFTLMEVDRLLGVVDQDERRCENMSDFTSTKITEITQKISNLQQMKSILEDLNRRCEENDDLYACPVIERLTEE